MNVHQLALACAVNINNKRKYVLLELPRTSAKTHRYLCGSKSPKGEIVADTANKKTLVQFDAIDVLAWCCANGVEYEIVEQ